MPKITREQIEALRFTTGKGVLRLWAGMSDAELVANTRAALELCRGGLFVVAPPPAVTRHFDDLWLQVIRSLEPRWRSYFGPRAPAYGATPSPSKWDQAPDTERIASDFGPWSVGEQVTMACLVSFYNRDEGQKLLEACGYPNFVDALHRLDVDMQAKTCALLQAYQGW